MTEYLIGKRERFSWVEETSFGTGGNMATNGEVIGINATLSPNFNLSWQEILSAGADNRELQGRKAGKKLLPYNLNFIPVNWRFLKYVFNVADGDDSGVKTHTFTLANTVKSYRLEWAKRHTSNVVYTSVGNFIKELTFNWSRPSGEGTAGFLNVSANCAAQDITKDSSVTSVNNITKDPFQFRHIKLIINGVEITELNNGEMNISNGIDETDSIYANSSLDLKIGEPIPKVFRVSGRFNINVKDGSFFDLWNAGTNVSGACSLLIDRDGSGDDQILFTFKNFYVFTPVEPTNLEGVNNLDMAWSADGFDSIVARDDIDEY